MSHQRTLIRKALVAAIKAADTAAGSRVFDTRLKALSEETFPKVLVFAMRDTTELVEEDPRKYKRQLTIGIELVAQAKASETHPEDQCDALALQIEDVIAGEMETWLRNGEGEELVTDLHLGDTEITHKEEQGEYYVAAQRISVVAIYHDYLPRERDGTEEDLNQVNTEYNLENNQDTDDAHHSITDNLQEV